MASILILLFPSDLLSPIENEFTEILDNMCIHGFNI